jgi:predicted unusual protein kinase regulating ubiquinone biosynthesis (AarF/ABC1/UbiB family)
LHNVSINYYSPRIQVAVKVQRPDIIDNVALDMHLLRSGAPIVKKLFNLQTDIVGVIDDWGVGFVNELDYNSEAKNAETFMEAIAKTPLSDAVFAPPVLHEVSTRRVLTTKWIDGEKLDTCTSADITQLCSVAMNTYLTMMLEMSILHCDPHPGNLKRTPDGKLCILDWGLVTSLQPDLQLSYIEHIAHLTSRDYANVPMDLVRLGFVPAGMEQAALEEGVVEVLTDVYTRFAGGGGAAKIDVNAVLDQMNGLAERYGRIFQVDSMNQHDSA